MSKEAVSAPAAVSCQEVVAHPGLETGGICALFLAAAAAAAAATAAALVW